MTEPAPAPADPTARFGPGTVATVAVGVVLLYLILLLDATRGYFVPQVVDLYLVLQYAHSMAAGHPFQYNPGDPATTGATSLLHTLLLALGQAVGARGEAGVAFAILLGGGLLVASSVVAWRAGRLLGGPPVALLSGLLVALGGPAAWGYLYGSDIALFMFLALWLLERLLAEWPGPSLRGSLAAATLLALARPEGLPIALAATAALWLGPVRAGRARGGPRLALPTAAALGVLLLNRALTGSWLGTSVADKSLLENYGLPGSLALATEYAQDLLRGVLLGFYPSQSPLGFARGWSPYYLPPLALVAMLAALLARGPLAAPLRVWAATAAAVCALVAPNTFMGVHYNRYLMWALPGALVLTAAGIAVVAHGLARGDASVERRLFAAVAAVALAGSLLSTLRFGVAYAEMASEVQMRDVAMAEFVSRELPPGARVANIATAVEYLTGVPELSLHGVTSPEFIGPRTAEREAGVLEALGRLAPERRPRWLISSQSRQENELTLQALADGEPLFRTSSFGDELLLLRTRWEAFGTGALLRSAEIRDAVAGLKEVDRLNVADAEDERQHSYRYESRLGSARLHAAPHADVYPGGETLLDGGRAILGHEEFVVGGLQPGRDLIVVVRSSAQAEANVFAPSGNRRVALTFPEAAMRITAGREPLPRFAFAPGPGWSEHLTRIPGSTVVGERLALRLEGRYAAFQYWFFQ